MLSTLSGITTSSIPAQPLNVDALISVIPVGISNVPVSFLHPLKAEAPMLFNSEDKSIEHFNSEQYAKAFSSIT